MALDVDINGNGYSLREDRDRSKVVTRPVQQFVQPIRQTGRTRPEDLAPYESFIIPNLMYGFGRYRVNSDVAFDPKEYRRFWDSTCDTRWADAIYLPILPEDTTQTNCDVIRASTNFKGETNALWDDLVSAGVHHVVNRQFTGASDTWENGGTVNPLIQGTDSFSLTSGTSVTKSVSFPAGPNKALIVVLNGIGGSSASISDPSAMTYAGDALTKLTGSTGTLYSSIWYLANPDSGTNNLVTTWSLSSTSRTGFGAVLMFHGVDQSTPMGSGATATGTATSATTTVTTAAGDYVVSSINFLTDGSITIPSGHVTLQNSYASDGGTTTGRYAMTYKIATDTSTAMDFTFGDSESFEHTTGIVNPASSPSIGIDLIQHKTNLVAMTCAEDDHLVYTSTDGATWSIATTPITAGLLANDVTANENIDAGLLATIGG